MKPQKFTTENTEKSRKIIFSEEATAEATELL